MISCQLVVSTVITDQAVIDAIWAQVNFLMGNREQWDIHVTATEHLKANSWELRFQLDEPSGDAQIAGTGTTPA